MAGIRSYGVSVPVHRMERRRIAEAHGRPGRDGWKAVANCDEDSVTLAVAAATDALGGPLAQDLRSVLLASTTLPYGEKLCATVLSAVLDLKGDVRTSDVSGSLRCASSALLAAADAVRGGGAALVAAADCRSALPDGENELLFGDGAAAFIVGEEPGVAEIIGSYSVSRDFHDQWRPAGDPYVKGWEERFALVRQQAVVLQAALSGLLERTGLAADDFAAVVLYAHSAKHQAELAQTLGFRPDRIRSGLLDEIGCAGAACAPLMLCEALEKAEPGDRILYLGYGEGCDAIAFRVTDAMRSHPARWALALGRRTRPLEYVRYLRWRKVIPIEPPRRPPQRRPSLPESDRNRDRNLALYGSRCTDCGTLQFPGARICLRCRSIDHSVPQRLSGRTGVIATYTVDSISASEDPPNVVAVVDLPDDVRMFCALTDCGPDDVSVGQTVELVLRRLHTVDGIRTYSWKGVPRDAGGAQGAEGRAHG